MDDRQILIRISELVEEEHQLRRRARKGRALTEPDAERLDHLEEHLDQAWDLLRQRRALREAGADPETAHERPSGQVESYLQ